MVQDTSGMKHITSRGVAFDMQGFMLANPDVRVVGNAKITALGDEVNDRGEIVKTRYQIQQEYQDTMSKTQTVRQVDIRKQMQIDMNKAISPEEAINRLKEYSKKEEERISMEEQNRFARSNKSNTAKMPKTNLAEDITNDVGIETIDLGGQVDIPQSLGHRTRKIVDKM